MVIFQAGLAQARLGARAPHDDRHARIGLLNFAQLDQAGGGIALLRQRRAQDSVRDRVALGAVFVQGAADIEAVVVLLFQRFIKIVPDLLLQPMQVVAGGVIQDAKDTLDQRDFRHTVSLWPAFRGLKP